MSLITHDGVFVMYKYLFTRKTIKDKIWNIV